MSRSCWEFIPVAPDLQGTYGGLFTFCSWFMFFQKGGIPPVGFDCFPVSLSPPTLWDLVSLNVPRSFRNKTAPWIFFSSPFLMAKQKSSLFSRKAQADPIMWIRNSRLFPVSREAAMAPCGTGRKSSSLEHPDGNHSQPFLWEFCVLQAEQESRPFTPAPQIPELLHREEKIQKIIVHTTRKKEECFCFPKDPYQS